MKTKKKKKKNDKKAYINDVIDIHDVLQIEKVVCVHNYGFVSVGNADYSVHSTS